MAGIRQFVKGAMEAADVAQDAPKKLSRNKKVATVRKPERVAYPGIYQGPKGILEDVNVAPESDNLQKVFGVTREELADIANRQGSITDPQLPGAVASPKGSAAAEKVMTPKNEQRLLDTLA